MRLSILRALTQSPAPKSAWNSLGFARTERPAGAAGTRPPGPELRPGLRSMRCRGYPRPRHAGARGEAPGPRSNRPGADARGSGRVLPGTRARPPGRLEGVFGEGVESQQGAEQLAHAMESPPGDVVESDPQEQQQVRLLHHSARAFRTHGPLVDPQIARLALPDHRLAGQSGRDRETGPLHRTGERVLEPSTASEGLSAARGAGRSPGKGQGAGAFPGERDALSR